VNNLKTGDVVVFGEGGDAAVGKIVSVGYPLTVIDFGGGMPPTPCFSGGISRRATVAECAEFEAEEAKVSEGRSQ